MQPPWGAFPHLHRRSIGWRQGEGEDYYNRFCEMFAGLAAAEQNAYEEAHPEPEDWRGFYGMIRNGRWKG